MDIKSVKEFIESVPLEERDMLMVAFSSSDTAPSEHVSVVETSVSGDLVSMTAGIASLIKAACSTMGFEQKQKEMFITAILQTVFDVPDVIIAHAPASLLKDRIAN